jgi:hypothetical protein
VFTIDPPTAKATQALKAKPMPQQNSPGVLDPALLRTAKEIYTIYCNVHPDRARRKHPIGVAIHKPSHRGKLIFSSYPILLPDECFIPIQQIETDLI